MEQLVLITMVAVAMSVCVLLALREQIVKMVHTTFIAISLNGYTIPVLIETLRSLHIHISLFQLQVVIFLAEETMNHSTYFIFIVYCLNIP